MIITDMPEPKTRKRVTTNILFKQLEQEDYGWKLIHGDVFRFPPHKNLFTAFVGLGAQLLTLTFAILSLALVGMFYPGNEGTMFTAAIVLYALTSGKLGYFNN